MFLQSFQQSDFMHKNIFASVITSLALSACNSHNEAIVNQSDSKEQVSQRPENSSTPSAPDADGAIIYSDDSLQYLALDSFELVSYQIVSDTLQLVSTNNFLYYPLGKLHTISSLKTKYPSIILKKEIDLFDNTADIYRATLDDSFIKIFLDDEKKTLEIVSGIIISPKIIINDNIKIGMKKRGFFTCFFSKPSSVEKKDIKVVELISGLDGIRHYYTFQGDTLVKIEFDTDYQFDKR